MKNNYKLYYINILYKHKIIYNKLYIYKLYNYNKLFIII